MRAFVLDASVAVKWVVEEEFTDRALGMLEASADLSAPGHWLGEVATALWAAAAVHRVVPRAQVDDRLRWLTELGVRETPVASLISSAAALAFELHATPYDTLYLALAERLRVPLVTADRKLFDKASAVPRLAPLTVWVGDL